MEITEFKRALFAGKVEFTFKKKNGEIRPSVGTLCNDLIPEADRPKPVTESEDKPKRKLSDDTVFYYDLEKNGFRSFKWDQFIEPN